MARRWIAAVFVLSLVVVVGWSQGAFAAARPANAGGGLELVGDGSRTVRFVAGEGRVTLVVRNVSAATGVLELDFIARGGERVTLTPRRPSGVQPRMSVLDPQDLRRPLARGGMRQVELRLGLPSDEAPQDGGGLLRARISSGSGTSVTVTLRGAAPDVVFDPPRLTIDVNQGCWGIATCGDTGIVVLRGRDAVAWARRTPRPRSTVILNNGDGGTVTVRLRHVVVQGGVVQATVDAGEPRDPGQYAGRLPIEPNGLAGPRLAVNVKIRWSIGVAVAVIFLGALFGGFFLRRFEIRRRRRLLELELLSALGRYDEERRLSG